MDMSSESSARTWYETPRSLEPPSGGAGVAGVVGNDYRGYYPHAGPTAHHPAAAAHYAHKIPREKRFHGLTQREKENRFEERRARPMIEDIRMRREEEDKGEKKEKKTKKDETSVSFRVSSTRRGKSKTRGRKEKERTSGEGQDGGQMTDEMRETRGKAKGQKVREGPRKKHDRAGPDLEALEGDIPDSCRRAWIILDSLLARGPQKTAPLIRIKSAVRLYVETTRKKRGTSCDFWAALAGAHPCVGNFFFRRQKSAVSLGGRSVAFDFHRSRYDRVGKSPSLARARPEF
ncbi:Trans-acting T-cell-specific transcription factor GATA-3 [Temnothorax longispinosus]|uniref:Trans-acting T-cell-specific transcription factor GATA-3 n=1 Tax=Temnothorax longispinosus TaxID=300112 RepID=A0A4S2KZF9_9HYME|nr:Trans-acting T-cell-specific transcription factor GATA-3 [Temnothorax longispinosus]